jgi:hypothetical protein
MQALLFLLILTAWYAVYRQWSRARVLSLSVVAAVALIVTVLLLNRHGVSDLGAR